MVKSMTAYARAEKEEDGLTVEVELRSYNGRFLDPHIKVSHGYNRFEEKIRGVIASHLVRGRVEARVSLRDTTDEAIAYEADEAKAKAYGKALRKAAEAAGISSDISLDNLLHASGLVVPKETETDFDHHWGVVAPCLSSALEKLSGMRRREGDFLAKDLLARLADVERSLEQISKGAEGLSAVYHERLKERIEALCGGVVEVESSRIAQEIGRAHV